MPSRQIASFVLAFALVMTAGCADEMGATTTSDDAPIGGSESVGGSELASPEPVLAVDSASEPADALTAVAESSTPAAGDAPVSADDPPACGVVPTVALEVIEADLAANDATVVKAVSWPLVRPKGITNLWAIDLDAVAVALPDGSQDTAVFLTAAYLLGGSWSSAVGDEIFVYAVDDNARIVSSFSEPDETIVKRTVNASDPEVAQVLQCLANM